jgi:ATP-dependent DNA helicase RecQ
MSISKREWHEVRAINCGYERVRDGNRQTQCTDVSEALDAYYQEIGRAGRDGRPANAVGIFSDRDLNSRRFFVSGGRLTEQDVEKRIEIPQQQGRPASIKQLAKLSRVSQTRAANAVARLEDQRALSRTADGRVRLRDANCEVAQAIAAAVGEQTTLLEGQRARLEPMHAFARSGSCRRRLLLDRNWSKGPIVRSGVDSVFVSFDHAGENRFSLNAVRDGEIQLAS